MRKQMYLIITAVLLFFGILKAEMSPVEAEMERIRQQYGERYLVVGTINNLVGVGVLKVKPDIMITEFELKTEGNTLEQASNENAKTMTEFKKYLISLGVRSDDIETSRYTRSNETVQGEKGKGRYVTKIDVRIHSLDTKRFYEVMEILEKEEINKLLKNDYGNYYTYTIESPVTTEKSSKQTAKDKYDRIEKKLISAGIENVEIASYNTSEAEPEKKQAYTVTHAFRVKMKTSVDMGKVLQKGQSYKIKNPGRITYDISEELKKKYTLEAYDKAMNEIVDKSKVILKNRGYEIGDIKYINDSSPYWNYNRSDPGIVMMQNRGDISANYKETNIDIPFSVAQEMSITVTLTASYDILKLKK
jgi:uncharacterized protein YggE